MKVTEHLERASNPLVSIEIIPPKRGSSITQISNAIESIRGLNPPFIDVTSHAAEIIWEQTKDGKFAKKVKRKRPGTIGLCAAIKYKYDLDPVPHLLCGGFTREETEDALIELNYLGIENILAIRGDKRNPRPVPKDRSENRYALDLVHQIQEMNRGEYLDVLENGAKTDFCVGVACYPEKHFECPNHKMGINILKQKAEAGADYAVTQMFYDTSKYIEFVKQAREAGIDIPIIPGLKIMTSKRHLSRLPSIFYIDIPQELVGRMYAAKTKEEERQVGIEWAYKQAMELLEFGVPCLHFYIMQRTGSFLKLMDRLKKQL